MLLILIYIISASGLDISSQYFNASIKFDECSIKKAAATSGLFSEKNNQVSASNEKFVWSPNGAVVRVWAPLNHSTFNVTAILEHFECQLRSQEQYCSLHGYKCYLFIGNSTNLWDIERENNSLNLQPHWAKIQVLRDILPFHPWVLLLDFDCAFLKVNSSLSIETLLKDPKYHSPSVIVPDSKGWTSNIMFFRNTAFSKKFIDHLWNLRYVCPRCVAEQCAVVLGMFDVLINYVASELRHDLVHVRRDYGHNCCDPSIYCEYPRTYNERNSKPTTNVQGCVWSWQDALGLRLYSIGHSFSHPIVKGPLLFMPGFRFRLGLTHNIKEKYQIINSTSCQK